MPPRPAVQQQGIHRTLLDLLAAVWQACNLSNVAVAYLGLHARRLAAPWTGLEPPCCRCCCPAPSLCQHCCLRVLLLLLPPLEVWGPWPRWHHLGPSLRGPQKRPALGLQVNKR
jgi:hypothetical protein